MTAQLGYWKIRGLAAPIRMLLHYCDVHFEDVHYEQGDPPELSAAAWLDKRLTLGLALPNLPYYIDDRGKFVQSLAIMRYIAARHGARDGVDLGHDDHHVDMTAHAAMDLRNAFTSCSYGSRSTEDVDRAVAQNIAPQLSAWDRLMASGRPFCTGDRLSYADFFLAEHIDQMRLVLPHAVQQHPALLAYADRFFALEKIQTFMRTPLHMKWPVNNKSSFIGAKPAT
jgi:glutathione S-transferase